MSGPRKIISGGQTGVDRVGLDVAIEAMMEHGGFCPKGRLAEDGVIPDCYEMTELETTSYSARTIRNIEAADVTLIFMDRTLGPGSLLTTKTCRELHKPYLYLHLIELGDQQLVDDFVQEAARLIEDNDARILNIAGSRGSKCRPEFLEIVRDVLWGVLACNA